MSFRQFLFDYYWWILFVLIVLVVGIIGYIVDAKQSILDKNVSSSDNSTKKEKKKFGFGKKNKDKKNNDIKLDDTNQVLANSGNLVNESLELPSVQGGVMLNNDDINTLNNGVGGISQQLNSQGMQGNNTGLSMNQILGNNNVQNSVTVNGLSSSDLISGMSVQNEVQAPVSNVMPDMNVQTQVPVQEVPVNNVVSGMSVQNDIQVPVSNVMPDMNVQTQVPVQDNVSFVMNPSIVTTIDGAKPFNISDMFANNR